MNIPASRLARLPALVHTKESDSNLHEEPEAVASRRWMPGMWAVLAVVLGCTDLATTARGPQGFEVPDPQPPAPVRYAIILLDADTTLEEGDFVLRQRAAIRSLDGRVIAAAVVDFGVTVGQVDPTTTPMNEDGTVAVTWTIPPEIKVGHLLGCARPPGQTCHVVPLLKWNR